MARDRSSELGQEGTKESVWPTGEVKGGATDMEVAYRANTDQDTMWQAVQIVDRDGATERRRKVRNTSFPVRPDKL